MRFAATMAVGLAATSVAIWLAASAVLRKQLDQALAGAAFLVANELQQAPQCQAVVHPLAVDALRYREEINRFVVIRDPHCRVLRAIPGWASDLPADSGAVALARSGLRSYSDARWHDMPMRSVYVAVSTDEGPRDQVVQVAASLDPVRALQRLMLVGLLGLTVLGTGATLGGAWRLAGSTVRPIREITEQATHIAAGTLGQRISAHAETEEYRGLVAVLNSMLQRLEAAFQAQRRFTGDVSHELRTPLTALRGEIEVALRSERTPHEYQRVFHSALEEIDRMTTMTEELLLISRAEAGLLTLHREPTDVTALVDASLNKLGGEIAEKELVVERLPATGVGQPLLDPGLIRQLIGELVENAVKYTGPGGHIRIATTRGLEGLRLMVENSGTDIGSLDVAQIFEPFYRADSARSRGPSTGLGLGVAAAIARLHGGGIRAGRRDSEVVWVEVDLPAPGEA